MTWRIGIIPVFMPVIISIIKPIGIIRCITGIGNPNHCALESSSSVINPEGTR